MATERDRRSRMAYSTVNAQPVKGGVGLGGMEEVYGMPMGPAGMQAVQLAPAPMMSSVVMAAPPQSVPTAADFPILAATVVPQQVAWGPGGGQMIIANPTPRSSVVLANMEPRQGVEFDASHPRNVFAKAPAQRVVVPATAGAAIDWSSTGMPVGMQQQIIRAGGGAAHVSAFAPVQVANQVPLNVLQAQVGATQSFSRQAPPQVSNRSMRSAGMIQQPRR